jgi:hypothetical protein
MSDIRQLVHSACYPSGNETYIRDQNTLTALFKEPGMSKLSSVKVIIDGRLLCRITGTCAGQESEPK